ncbi:MAG TPA: hypothetical protein VE961_02225 [Pyrinomonadaceae bacterium]|nr:hypothetical protein [Pyrinomonadaceae bacterium]
MRRKLIGILLHKDDTGFIFYKYLIKLLIKEWRALGFATQIIRGTDRLVPADIVISHVDLTVVPDEYKEFLAQYPCAYNRSVPDISKSRISTNLVGRDDPYAGPVIVKTDRNSGGFAEVRMVGRGHLFRALGRRLAIRNKVNTEVAWDAVRQLRSGEYPVFSSLQNVPPEIFSNQHLVIEKFLPEIIDDHYHISYYHFLGDMDLVERYQSKDKVVKASTSIGFEMVPVPPEVREFRKKLGMDYGKIDYVINDGKLIILDVNPTPVVPAKDALTKGIARHLAAGITSPLSR